jgi:MFS family permease
MKSYFLAIARLPRDLKLFIVFNLLANVGFGVFQLVFNLYLVELDFREDYIGAFNSVQTVFMGLAGLTLGLTISRLGIWHSLLSGVVVFFAASYLVSIVEQPIILLVLSALFGFGLCYLFNFSMPFSLEFSPPEERARVAAVTFSVVSLAITIGSLVGGFMPDIVHRLIGESGEPGVTAYRLTLITGTTIAALGLIPLMLMGEARRSKAAQELARAAITETPIERKQVKRDLSAFAAVAGLMSLGVGMVIPFYNVFLTTLGADSQEVGYVFAFGSGAAAIIGLAAPWLSRRVGSLNAVFGLRLIMLPAYALLIVAPGYGLAIIAHAVRQTSINMNWPIDSTFMGELLPPRARATAFGWRSGAWNIGTAVASLIGGWIIVRWGYSPTFAIMIIFTAISAVLFTTYFRRHPKVQAGEIAQRTPTAKQKTERVTV